MVVWRAPLAACPAGQKCCIIATDSIALELEVACSGPSEVSLRRKTVRQKLFARGLANGTHRLHNGTAGETESYSTPPDGSACPFHNEWVARRNVPLQSLYFRLGLHRLDRTTARLKSAS
jgi:hypothetical protein